MKTKDLINILNNFKNENISINDINKLLYQNKDGHNSYGVTWIHRPMYSMYEALISDIIIRIYYNKKDIVRGIYGYTIHPKGNKRIFNNAVSKLNISVSEFFNESTKVVPCEMPQCRKSCKNCSLDQTIVFSKLLSDANVVYDGKECLDVLVDIDYLLHNCPLFGRSYIKINKRDD